MEMQVKARICDKVPDNRVRIRMMIGRDYSLLQNIQILADCQKSRASLRETRNRQAPEHALFDQKSSKIVAGP